MFNDETNTPAIEPETPIIESAAPETKVEKEDGPKSLDTADETVTAEPSEQDGDAEPEGTPEPEYADVEYDGKIYQVPPELKEAFLRQADYTRKTQEVAEIRKQAEAVRAEAETVRQVAGEELNARVTLTNLDSQLKQYEGVDWNAYDPNDPLAEVEMSRHWRNYQALQQQRGQVANYLQTAEQQRSVSAQQETVKRLQETRSFAEKEIKGWTPEIDDQVTNFAMNDLGFPREALLNAYSPPVYKALYLAWLGAQSIQRSAAKPAPVAAKPQPLQRITAKSNVPSVKSPETMSMDEYAAWRSKQR